MAVSVNNLGVPHHWAWGLVGQLLEVPFVPLLLLATGFSQRNFCTCSFCLKVKSVVKLAHIGTYLPVYFFSPKIFIFGEKATKPKLCPNIILKACWKNTSASVVHHLKHPELCGQKYQPTVTLLRPKEKQVCRIEKA